MNKEAVKDNEDIIKEEFLDKKKYAVQSTNRFEKIFAFIKSYPALLMLVALVIIGNFLSPVFLTQQNLLNIIWIVSVLGIMSLGQTLLLISHNFDMSIAYIVGLSGITTVLAQRAGLGLMPSILLGLASGALVGMVNGLLGGC